jgi:hypothetical protein
MSTGSQPTSIQLTLPPAHACDVKNNIGLINPSMTWLLPNAFAKSTRYNYRRGTLMFIEWGNVITLL